MPEEEKPQMLNTTTDSEGRQIHVPTEFAAAQRKGIKQIIQKMLNYVEQIKKKPEPIPQQPTQELNEVKDDNGK